MPKDEIIDQLEKIKNSSDFIEKSEELVENWIKNGENIEIIEQVIHFMEENPDIDYGMPGALVHFVERFYRHGYEEILTASVRRRPTFHTIWMLNRLINGSKDHSIRRKYITELRKARLYHPLDERTLNRIEHFLELLIAE